MPDHSHTETIHEPGLSTRQSLSRIEQIIDLARWAPSGDNTQPWRFEIKDDHHFVIHGHDTRDHCVYDLRGRASQIAIGALIETIHVAATGHGLKCDFHRRTDSPETLPTFDVELSEHASTKPDPLLRFVTSRVTQRRPMRTRAITNQERSTLESAAEPAHRVIWLGGISNRLRVAKLLFRNAHIRLTTHEAYLVHRQIIDWGTRFSADRIPDKAVGLDPVALKLMRWAMGSWGRVQFMNRYLAGTWLPRLQLDFLPGIRCGAHFLILADTPPRSIDDYVSGGRALQRFWLTATSLDLLVQPEMTPLIFSSYVRDGLRFTRSQPAWDRAQGLSERLDHLIGTNASQRAIFMGRIGAGRTPSARSVRLPLERLMTAPA